MTIRDLLKLVNECELSVDTKLYIRNPITGEYRNIEFAESDCEDNGTDCITLIPE